MRSSRIFIVLFSFFIAELTNLWMVHILSTNSLEAIFRPPRSSSAEFVKLAVGLYMSNTFLLLFT
jgi:hypothetical protein